METMSWTSDQLFEQFSGCNNLGDVIQSLEKDFWDKGEVICEIRIDDKFISEDEEAGISTTKFDAISKLEVISKRPQDLLLEATQSYLEMIPDLKNSAVSCSETFRTGEMVDAQRAFADTLEGCRWITDALYLLRTNIANWTKVEGALEEWNRAEKAYASTVRELLDAYEKGDFVLLADLLEYELSNRLDEWHVILSAKQEMMKNK